MATWAVAPRSPSCGLVDMAECVKGETSVAFLSIAEGALDGARSVSAAGGFYCGFLLSILSDQRLSPVS